QAPGGGLEALALVPPGRYVHRIKREAYRERRGQPCAEMCIVVTRRTPKAVCDVRRDNRDAAPTGPFDGEKEKRRGVTAARMRHEKRARVREERLLLDVAGEPVLERLVHPGLSSALRPDPR